MKIFRNDKGVWEWRIRARGLVGQANGFSLTRTEAIEQALKRLDWMMRTA
jgi:hypothetical protein